MFLHARADGEDVGVEDDVVGIEPYLVDQQLVGSSADLHFTLCVCGLERVAHVSGGYVRVLECATDCACVGVCLLTCPSSSNAMTTTAAP